MSSHFQNVFYSLKYEIQVSMIIRHGGIVCITEWQSLKAMLILFMGSYVEAIVDPISSKILYFQRPNCESLDKYIEKIISKS